MDFTNTIKLTMENEEAAKAALAVIRKTLRSGNYNSNYGFNTAEELADDLQVNGSQITNKEDGGYFLPEDICGVMTDVLKAVAEMDSIHTFDCEVVNDSTYSESYIEANYRNGMLNINNTYYPEGYCEYLYCPECGEEVVLVDDFDPSKTYFCPECGEEIDLLMEYETVRPQIENTSLKIS